MKKHFILKMLTVVEDRGTRVDRRKDDCTVAVGMPLDLLGNMSVMIN